MFCAVAPAKIAIMTRALRGVRKPDERDADEAAAAAVVEFGVELVELTVVVLVVEFDVLLLCPATPMKTNIMTRARSGIIRLFDDRQAAEAAAAPAVVEPFPLSPDVSFWLPERLVVVAVVLLLAAAANTHAAMTRARMVGAMAVQKKFGK